MAADPVGPPTTYTWSAYSLNYDEGCHAGTLADGRSRAETQEKLEMEDDSIFIAEILESFFSRCEIAGILLSKFFRSQDSIANGALVIARLQATARRPGWKAHHDNSRPAKGKPE
jgi:hypothetical protein